MQGTEPEESYMTTDLYERIVSQRGTIAGIGERIPGYRGYMEAQVRRAADRLLRDYVVAQFERQLQRLPGIEETLMRGGGLEWMSDTRSAKSKMQTFIDRIRTAARGYSGLFSNIKIDSDELERLYAFDEAMLRYVDQFAEGFDALEQAAASNKGIREAIAALDALTGEANQAFDLRKDVIISLTGEEAI
jgi:hypothetical protein